jgi:hypothetical protein
MDLRPRSVLIGFAAGVGAAVVLPFVAPVISEVVRPLIKTLLKQGMLGFERVRTATARAAEGLEDLLAEVRIEVDSELKESATATPTPNVLDAASKPKAARGNGAPKRAS